MRGYALPPPTDPSLYHLIQLHRHMESIEGDIRHPASLLQSLQSHSPDIVIHMAAQPLVRQSYLNPVETYETNAMGTVHLLEAVRQTPSVQVVLNITTDKCYDNREWVWGYREQDSLGGYDPYSNSKACSELVTSSYRNSFFSQSSVAIATARAGNVIGGGDWATDRLIPDCIRRWLQQETVVLRYPHARRPWQHVLEPLSGYLCLAEKLFHEGNSFAESWNFGPRDDDAASVGDVVEKLSRSWGEGACCEIDTQPQLHEATYLKLDCSKAASRLGWKPRWNLDTALEKTVEWYKAYHQNPRSLESLTLQQIQDYTLLKV